MISDGCYVFIVLPGTTKPVVCGRLGLLRAEGRFVATFTFGRSYLARRDAVPLDPVTLNVPRPGLFTYEIADEIFPVLRDASPDRWGRLVLERLHGGVLDEIACLLLSPDDRAGALSFGATLELPSASDASFGVARLSDLVAEADALLRGEASAPARVERLMLLGTSMGGARPKCVIEHEDALWVAKFPRPDDRFDQPRVEAAMLDLARLVGIDSAEARLVDVGGRAVLLSRRFDRARVPGGYLRHRMVSALTVLQASDSATDRSRWSYLRLSECLRRYDRSPAAARRELFRRMVFNAAISNIDDHPRNHAMIEDGSGWRLSPAYDLTPTPMLSSSRDLALVAGEDGRRISSANLVSRADAFGMTREEAMATVELVVAMVEAGWEQACLRNGVSSADRAMIRSAFPPAHMGRPFPVS
jgi:serine/threonine-protein kinase HipA